MPRVRARRDGRVLPMSHPPLLPVACATSPSPPRSRAALPFPRGPRGPACRPTGGSATRLSAPRPSTSLVSFGGRPAPARSLWRGPSIRSPPGRCGRSRGSWGTSRDLRHAGVRTRRGRRDEAGAVRGILGYVEGGTLQLDELGYFAPEALAQLSDVIKTGQYRRWGSNASRRADVRFVATTSRTDSDFPPGALETFTRRIDLPPLRERLEDVPLLVRHFAVERGANAEEVEPCVYEGPAETREARVHWRMIDELLRQPMSGNGWDVSRSVAVSHVSDFRGCAGGTETC